MLNSFLLLVGVFFASVSGHGNMITPAPRQAHNQRFDSRNKCGCASTPEGCYSNATSPGTYCGLGCIGEACLYYQIGCFQSCPVCSYTGKTLYPVLEDLKKAVAIGKNCRLNYVFLAHAQAEEESDEIALKTLALAESLPEIGGKLEEELWKNGAIKIRDHIKN